LTAIAMTNIRIGKHEIPDVLEPRCHTCTSEHRESIERLLLEGHGYEAVVRRVPQAGLSARNLKDHVMADHIPIHSAAVVALSDRRAVERGEVLAPVAEAAAGHLEFAKLVLGKVRDKVERGEIEPGLRDGLKAAEILDRAGMTSALVPNEYVEMVREAFLRIVEIIKDETDVATERRIAKRLSEDSKLATLDEQWASSSL